MSFTTIAIIYNPNSTGSSQELAKQYSKMLKKRLPKQKIELIGTDHAGHAEELAYSIAKASKRPLIVSSSGDGGYNEVVNGAVKASLEGATPTTSLLPAGNANDHYRNLSDDTLVDDIVNEKILRLDVLKLVGTVKGKRSVRYAHSYIGFGLTPQVGNELNKTKLNLIKETAVVAKALFSLKAVRLVIGNKKHSYDSIILSNVDSMSKYLKVSQPSKTTDGKFEVTIFRRKNKLKLIMMLLKASAVGLKQNLRTDHYTLTTTAKTLVQLDGEIMTLDAHTRVNIGIEKQALRCIL